VFFLLFTIDVVFFQLVRIAKRSDKEAAKVDIFANTVILTVFLPGVKKK
jgi:hypothetical protein